MAELPTGTVTFLFTDIERSTRLMDELGDRYTQALEEHNRLIRATVETHGSNRTQDSSAARPVPSEAR